MYTGTVTQGYVNSTLNTGEILKLETSATKDTKLKTAVHASSLPIKHLFFIDYLQYRRY